jgi:thioredoxin-related protein
MKANRNPVLIAAVLLISVSLNLHAQQTNQQQSVKPKETVKLYDPSLDGMKQIKEGVIKAKAEKKHLLIQYGGNWCPWCIKFDAFCKADSVITRTINENYVPVKMNYDQTSRNDEANEFMGNPTRFGFPVFIIIDGNGNVIHIQDSGLLEEGQGYDRNKVIGFFRNWTPDALVPQNRKQPAAKK